MSFLQIMSLRVKESLTESHKLSRMLSIIVPSLSLWATNRCVSSGSCKWASWVGCVCVSHYSTLTLPVIVSWTTLMWVTDFIGTLHFEVSATFTFALFIHTTAIAVIIPSLCCSRFPCCTILNIQRVSPSFYWFFYKQDMSGYSQRVLLKW